MSYRQPGLSVTQQFVNALPALAVFSLPNVSVGPAFQVVDEAFTGNYDGNLDTFNYPGQIAGTVVDLRALDPTDLTSYPVSVFFDQAVIETIDQTGTGAVSAYNLNQWVDSTSNIFQNVAPGDVIAVTGSTMGNDGNYTVRSVVNSNTLQTNETFAAIESGLDYTILRNLVTWSAGLTPSVVFAPFQVTSSVIASADNLTVGAAEMYTDPVYGAVPVVSARVLVSYRAIRFEKSNDVYEYTATSQLQTDFGIDQIVPENTVVFAAFLALNNSVTATNILGLDFNFFDNELLAYDDAFAILALNDLYAISVLTQNTAVHTALKAHVDGYSAPGMNLERVGIINRAIVLTQVVVPTVASGALSNLVGSQYLTFTDTDASFLTDGVVPGNFINFTAPGGIIGRFKISAVTSQTVVTLVTGPTSAPGGISYFVDENLTLDQQASVLAAYAESLGDRRMVMTWPDQVNIPVGNVIRPLPGYFLNPCIGALTTGLPPQQGFTNLTVAVYAGVIHSTKYFTNTQLNTIAGGGVMIFIQTVLNQTPLLIRHQLTTNTSAILYQEYSITKDVDFVAKFLRSNSGQYIGQFNIVKGTFDALKTQGGRMMNYLVSGTILPQIGGVLVNGKLSNIVQDPNNIDGILETFSIGVPVPLNHLDITLLISGGTVG